MGVVYKAYDHVLEEAIALKILAPHLSKTPDLVRRFRSEIKLARKVSHWNVCRIHDYGEASGLFYISMEFIEGTTLRQLLATRGLLLPHEAYDITMQTGAGLAAIHRAGIIHRDLKPANIMIDSSGVVRVMDFGIAKVGQKAITSGISITGQAIGTPAYMSPEQVRGEKLDFRSDLYALGVVIYELFTGDVPFSSENPVALMMKHVHDPPPLEAGPGARLPAKLVTLLRKALAKNPDERQASVAGLIEELKAAHDDICDQSIYIKTTRPLDGPRSDHSPPTTSRARASALPWKSMIAGLVAVALAILILLWNLPGRLDETKVAGGTNALSQSTDHKPERLSIPPQESGLGKEVASPRNKPAGQMSARSGLAGAAKTPSTRPSVEDENPPLPQETPLSAPRNEVEPYQIKIGTSLVIRIDAVIRSDRCRPGDEFEALLDEPLMIGGEVIAAANSLIKGRIENVGFFAATSELRGRPFIELSLYSLELNGVIHSIRTGYYRLVAPAPSGGGPDIRAIVIGAVSGAAIGGSLAGKKGAAVGAVSGATIGAALTTTNSDEYHVGNRLTFKLAEALEVWPTSS